jgi:ribonuclease D
VSDQVFFKNSANLSYSPNNNPPAQDQSTIDTVDEARKALEELNTHIKSRTGTRATAPRPALLPTIEELLKDPPPPDFPLLEDEVELIKYVSVPSLMQNLLT